MTTVQLLIPVVVVLLGLNPESVAAEKKETGHWGDWGAATPCSASCGAGVREMRREWMPAPGEVVEGGKPFTSSRTFYCTNNDVPHCPINGTWSGWSAWTQCTKVCGGGTRDRQRGCYGRLYSGNDCPGDKKEQEDCSREPCPPLPRNFDMNQCTEKGNFTCNSKKMCVPIKGRCNQNVECHDGSDEIECPRRLHASRVRYDLRNLATTVHGLDSILKCSAITMLMIVMAKMFANEA